MLFGIYYPLGVKLFTRLRLQFSHLNEHKFRHGFCDTINPMCSCGTEVETTFCKITEIVITELVPFALIRNSSVKKQLFYLKLKLWYKKPSTKNFT